MNFRLVSALTLTLAIPLAAAPALAATPPRCPTHVDVRNVMTVTQYDQAGLNKLDKKQLAALNAWLSHYIGKLCAEQTAETPPSPKNTTGTASAGAAGKSPSSTPHQSESGQRQTTTANTTQEPSPGNPSQQKNQKPGRIESRIVGEFHGWTGNTIFRLENGQVWKQAGPGYFRIDLKNPKVIIKKLLIGYVLKLNGYGREVFVRRIR